MASAKRLIAASTESVNERFERHSTKLDKFEDRIGEVLDSLDKNKSQIIDEFDKLRNIQMKAAERMDDNEIEIEKTKHSIDELKD